MKYLIIIILGIIVIWYFFFNNTYQGVFYPNGCLICEDDYIFSPVFKTREECINWAVELARERDNPLDDYECGKNCKMKSGLMICKETFDF